MFTRILLPLDGSPRAERAIPTAVQLVRASKGTLILAHVRTMDAYFGLGYTALMTQELIAQDLKAGAAYLTRIAASLELGEASVEQVVTYGPVASTLFSLITTQSADLVVLTSHGRTGFTRWALGSIAEKLAKASPVPVLILREGGPLLLSTHPEALRPLRALVPLDGSLCAKAALEPAAQLVAALAPPLHGAIHLVRVVNPSSPTVLKGDEQGSGQEWHQHLLHKAKAYLGSLSTHVREGFLAPTIVQDHLQLTWSVALDADVAHALIRVAENGEDAEGAGSFGGCQLIVMATHGRSGLEHWAVGSITERVLHGTKLPILVIRPPQATVQQERLQEKNVALR